MFKWLFGKKEKIIEEETKKGFSSVKKDIEAVGKWIKHLDGKDKQLFDMISSLQGELSSLKDDLEGVKEAFEISENEKTNRQLFKKLPVLDKQTAVYGVEKAVQTAVQTANFYDIFKGMSSNERLVIFTLLNTESGMKLSYEDIARLLGKERSTIRGQINAIKQKREGLIEEQIEKNGKKRVFIPEEIKEKLRKYAKVRVRWKKNDEDYVENVEESEK